MNGTIDGLTGQVSRGNTDAVAPYCAIIELEVML